MSSRIETTAEVTIHHVLFELPLSNAWRVLPMTIPFLKPDFG